MGDKKRQDPKGKFHKIGLRIFAAFASRFFGIVQNDSIPPIRRAYGAFGSYCKNTVDVLQYGCAADCSHIVRGTDCSEQIGKSCLGAAFQKCCG